MSLHITSITGPDDRPKRNRARADRYADIDPQDIDPNTGAPYEDYSSPCIEPHPFGGGMSAEDY